MMSMYSDVLLLRTSVFVREIHNPGINGGSAKGVFEYPLKGRNPSCGLTSSKTPTYTGQRGQRQVSSRTI